MTQHHHARTLKATIAGAATAALIAGVAAAALTGSAAASPTHPQDISHALAGQQVTSPTEPALAEPTPDLPSEPLADLLAQHLHADTQGWVLPAVYQPASEPSKRTIRQLENTVTDDLAVPVAVAFSDESKDLTGRKPSLYRGKYFDPRFEQYRLCVSKRESEHTGSVRGGGGNRYTGFYQFSPELARGATWMMMAEAKDAGLADDVERLRDKPMNTWPRYFQDWAFWRVFNHGDGAQHWAGGRWSCNPAPNAEQGW